MNAAAHLPVEDATPEFLSLSLGDTDYAVDLGLVQAIQAHDHTPELCGAPPCLRGVTDEQGRFVPLLDLCSLLNGRSADATAQGVIVIVELQQRRIGLLVEAVNDVVELLPEPALPAGSVPAGRWAKGVRGTRRVQLLDLARLSRHRGAALTL